MKNILENALNGETVSFNTRTYGVDASLTEMLFGPWGPVNLNPAGAFFNRVDPIAPVEPIKPLSTWGAVIPIPTTIELPVMDIHETFKIDRYDNIYGGHTTLLGLDYKKKRFSWEK